MMMLVPLMIVPIVVMGPMWAGNRGKFTVKEFALLEAIMFVLVLGGFQAARYGAVTDTELWNGHITKKYKGTETCCHCTTVCDSTDEDGNCTSSHEECDHSYDNWWSLDVSTGDTLHEGCDGSWSSPNWWKDAYVGEPASVPHSYINYLLADPDSVLLQHIDTTGYEGGAPNYPKVFGKYHVTRFIHSGTVASVGEWDNELDIINDNLGAEKQVNIIVIATTDSSPTYADMIEVEWLYGKKNDVIFVLGAPDGDTIEWAKVVTISNVEMLKLTARDEMPGMKLSNPVGTSGYIQDLVSEKFERTPMVEYEYLWASAQPGPFSLIFLYLLAIVGSIGGSFVMVEKDVFGDEHRRW